jgi:hypothetical protein
MKKRLLIASLLALSLLALALSGPQTPAQDPASAEAAAEAAAAEPEAPPDTEPLAGEPLEAFEPTEKLAAESAVSFPVDI